MTLQPMTIQATVTTETVVNATADILLGHLTIDSQGVAAFLLPYMAHEGNGVVRFGVSFDADTTDIAWFKKVLEVFDNAGGYCDPREIKYQPPLGGTAVRTHHTFAVKDPSPLVIALIEVINGKPLLNTTMAAAAENQF